MKTIEFKLLLKSAQVSTLESWLSSCCWIYNRALEMRIKAHKRRDENVNYNQQQKWLTGIRKRKETLADVPFQFERDALRRVDRGMKAFFRRLKDGSGKFGFPRFKSVLRYDSMEYAAKGRYVRGNNLVSIPRLGLVRIRCGNQRISGEQKLLRIIRRASGWYGQVIVDDVSPVKNLEDHGPVGIDVGLESFATMSDGSKIANPRFYRKSERRLAGLQRSVSRKKKGSNNRKKAVTKLRRQHEKISNQRRCFCHHVSTELVRKHPIIAVEKLNIGNMVRNRRLAKSISDAGWGTFTTQLKVKAEEAGRLVVEVNPSGTSQECPECGAIKRKKLSERTHSCGQCGLECHRDHAAAQVILARGLMSLGSNRPWRDSTSDSGLVVLNQAGPVNREREQLISR